MRPSWPPPRMPMVAPGRITRLGVMGAEDRVEGLMLRANDAVRLGLRAASRNPELAFGKALLDLAGSALSLLPVALGAVFIAAAAGNDEPLAAALHIARLLRGLALPLAAALLPPPAFTS